MPGREGEHCALTDCRIDVIYTPMPKRSSKVRLTVLLTRPSVAALDRISAKRIEAGAGRRQVQRSALIEEAIQALRKRVGV